MLVNRTDEIRHLHVGSELGEKPKGIGVVQFVASCPGNAEVVLHKCREVLEIVLNQDPDNWPTDDNWYLLLPEWFVSASSKKTLEEEEQWLKWWQKLSWKEQVRASKEKQWSVDNWIYWFQPDERTWFWWDATIESPKKIKVKVEVKELPFASGSLNWLFRAAGATSLEEE